MDRTEQPLADRGEAAAQLRRMITERREGGLSPDEPTGADGFEGDGAEMMAAPAEPPDELVALHRELEILRGRARFDPGRIGTTSSVPGGSAVHRAVARLVTRQTRGVLLQVEAFADQTIRLLEKMMAALEDHATGTHHQLEAQLDGILIRLARFERLSAGPDVDVAHLRRRVEDLEATEATRGFHPWFSNQRFEEQFRGSHDDLLERYRDVAVRLRGCGPVLDIGFGRGEVLELLKEMDVEARGVEIDSELVKDAREKGLDAIVGDGLATLAGYADGGLGGIVLVQVVEHLTAQQLLELIAMAFDKLRPGGQLVMETVNPQSLYVFANSFYLDPTHQRPIHPAYLEFLCRQIGFPAVDIDWRSLPPEGDRLAAVNGSPALTGNIDKLNRLLFGPGDYAVFATR